MKKLIVGVLVVVGLLAVAGSASAQGMADPLGLVASGAIVPFWSAGGDVSILEISSPAGPNTAPNSVHLVFFTASCTRDVSVNLPLTENDVAIPVLDEFIEPDFNGLVAIGGSLNGIDLVALRSPIHVQVHRFNFVTGQDYARVYEPITALNADEVASVFPAASKQTWNPIRTGATFAVPVLDGAFLNANLDLVCPRESVYDAWVDAVANIPAHTFEADTAAKRTIQGVIFDDNEKFLRDITTTCDCLAERNVRDLNVIYRDATATAAVFQTELLAPATSGFVAWRTIRVTFGSRAVDDFGRLPNGNRDSLGGVTAGAVTGTGAR